MASPERRRLGHVGALDGLRAVAVVAVLLFHGGVSWAPGGFLGVDVFFVLSGFLITTLLMEEVGREGRVSLRAFWTRRARRLIPALLATVVAVVAAASYLAPARPARGIHLDAAAALGYVANWRFIFSGASYFDRTAGPSPLEHTWSLAVEEQFYLVWPLLALLLLRRGRSWPLALVAGLGAVASAVTMALLHEPGTDTSRAYFGTDSRVHVVLIGAVTAFLLARRPAEGVSRRGQRLVLGAAALTGAAAVAAAIAVLDGDDTVLYRGGFAAVSVATAAVVAGVVLVPDGLLARALSLSPLQALGRISYGVYLWHWPIFLFLTAERVELQGYELLGVRLVATLAVSVLSAFLLEDPLRHGSLLRGFRAGVVLPAVAAVVAAVLVVGAYQQGVEAEVPTTFAVASGPAASASDTAEPEAYTPPAPGEPARVLIVGDSVAQTLAQGLLAPAERAGLLLAEHTVLGCGIARGGPYRYFGDESAQPPQCEDWPTRWRQIVHEQDPHLVLLVIGRWEVMDRVRAGRWTRIGTTRYDRYLRDELDRAFTVVSSAGARVAVATAPYYRRGERPDGGIWPEDEPWRVDRFNQLLREVAVGHPKVTVVDLNTRTTSEPGTYTASVDGVRLRYDGVHFTRPGARLLAPWLFPQLQAVLQAPAPAPPRSRPR